MIAASFKNEIIVGKTPQPTSNEKILINQPIKEGVKKTK
jgi:hypothetical protein